MEINIKQQVDLQEVAELLSCAFEGGTGYWCRIHAYVVPPAPSPVLDECEIFKHTDYPLTEGGAVVCVDTDLPLEEQDELHLNLASVQKGLELLANKHPQHFADFQTGKYDATTGDVFLQLCLLGEYIYS